jgi:uncharacterized membrane protein
VLRDVVRVLAALIGAALLLVAAVTLAHGQPAGLQALIAGVVLIAGVLFERAAYKPLEKAPPVDRFQPTAERFIDPETRAAVTVYVDPATGERKYVRD